ncbi:ES1 protein homolog, mitochondrial isoform X1 [Eurytemora carolleeae]|uniref:ES1 protein homolog, mitochondrial isoform X1 n=1 Tax=Eurytemora carolleeae TaxID=1294199 RepID=UPI000C778F92|nr:ES1 protein homolog, mitochondrial isoform X1 [Eurytemora carolleeae]|eukprot:XP_023349725.1 ES1 protein homolog, mitochondrial-like isoform X1 [Eurytemora affinis]
MQGLKIGLRTGLLSVNLGPGAILSAAMASAAGHKVAVVLSGCGVYDGTEVHEAAAVLAALSRHGATPLMFAPDKKQAHVIDHTAGSEMDQERNVLKESARIARGSVSPLSELKPGDVSAVVFPGGFGAAKNLSDFGFKGADMDVDPEVRRIISEFHTAGKPQALCCIAPILAAKVLGEFGVTLTLGNTGAESDWPYQGSIEAAKSFGANMQLKNVDEVVTDEKNKVVSTPAFMFNGQFHQIQDGVTKMIDSLVKLL